MSLRNIIAPEVLGLQLNNRFSGREILNDMPYGVAADVYR